MSGTLAPLLEELVSGSYISAEQADEAAAFVADLVDAIFDGDLTPEVAMRLLGDRARADVEANATAAEALGYAEALGIHIDLAPAQAAMAAHGLGRRHG
jgi:hypothetical protein